MAEFTVLQKRAFLRQCRKVATSAGATLLATLEDLANGHVESVSGGYLISGTSRQGFSVSHSIGITPLSFAGLLEELIERYEAAASSLSSTDENEIYDEMRAEMACAYSGAPSSTIHGVDFSEAR